KGYRAVNVTLTDYAIAGPAALPTGNYEFVVTNRGSVPHELVMWATKAPAAGLPLRKDGDADEEADALEGALGAGGGPAPRERRVLYADLTTAGPYALVCNLPSHSRLGMHLDLAVG